MAGLERRLTIAQLILLGFAAVILLGTLVLMLPVSARDGQGASFGQALFTATSAVCVTGLVVQDTATFWSGFGQAAILCLIQIGGMGVMTVALTISVLSGRPVGLRQRRIMQESISAPQVGGIIGLTGFILRTTFLVELAGAAALAPVFCREFGLLRGVWYALFHSVSAFCNAGFDLMGVREHYSSLTAYAAQPVVSLVIPLLIVVGGLGFSVWDDLRRNRFRWRRYRLQTKVVLTVTALLLVVPAVVLFFLELSDLPLGERLLGSFFQSATLRTAGFNTLDLTRISESGQVMMIALMLIGGSPGSTAGGMKTTTLAVLVCSAWAVFRRKGSTTLFGRRAEEEAVRSAAAVLLVYLSAFLVSGCVISRIEGLPLLPCLFETASAMGTVGLSLGLTPGMGGLSRCILIALMYAGRVGGLTLFFAAVSGERAGAARLPRESLTIG